MALIMCAVIDGRLLLLAIFLQISRRSLADISDNVRPFLAFKCGYRCAEFERIHCENDSLQNRDIQKPIKTFYKVRPTLFQRH